MFSKRKEKKNKTKKEKEKNEFLLHYKLAGGLQGAEAGSKVTLTFILASISSFAHLPPSFLASLSPHNTSSSKTVFSTGGSVFSTRGSYRNHGEAEMVPKSILRGWEIS